MPKKPRVPAYRLHKPTGQAVVTIRTAANRRRDVYLGAFGSEESHREYKRVIAEQATDGPGPLDAGPTANRYLLTVDEVLVAFLRDLPKKYRASGGRTSAHVGEYKLAVRPLHELYGHTRAAHFGPLALKAVRQTFVGAGVSRGVVNARVGKIKRLFRWATENEMIPAATYTAIETVANLEEGLTDARETEPVGPVDPARVDATLPFLSRQLRGLVQFLRFTGCRPSEAAVLRRCDLDASGPVWLYRPAQHKTRHKGKSRVIAIGPKAQAVLKEFFTDDPGAVLFSPRAAVAERNAARRASRRTPMTPSQAARKGKANPERQPSERYGRQAILTAVVRACDEAFPPAGELARKEGESVAAWRARLATEHREAVKAWRREHQWFPYQLRHLFATEVRKGHGLEAAQVLLGHSRADVTQLYAAKNEALAAKVAAELG